MKVCSTYIEEIKADTGVDELSLKEKALLMPGIKAKWVSRLIMHKNAIRGLEKQKSKIISEVMEGSKVKVLLSFTTLFYKKKRNLLI